MPWLLIHIHLVDSMSVREFRVGRLCISARRRVVMPRPSPAFGRCWYGNTMYCYASHHHPQTYQTKSTSHFPKHRSTRKRYLGNFFILGLTRFHLLSETIVTATSSAESDNHGKWKKEEPPPHPSHMINNEKKIL